MPTVTWHLTPWSNVGNTTVVVEVDPGYIRGMQGVFGPCLSIPYTTSVRGQYATDTNLLSLEGWLVSQSEHAFASGIRIPSQIVSSNERALRVPLTFGQIEAIEDVRRGEAAIFNMVLTGVAAVPNPQVLIVSRTQRLDGQFEERAVPRLDVVAVRTSSGNSEIVRIEREQWLTILQILGVGKRRLVELPEPVIPNDQQRWDECLRQLDEATRHHRRGEYEQALEHCRKVVEGIATVLGGVWHVPQRPGRSFDEWTKELGARLAKAWSSDKGAPKMLGSLLSAAYAWTSPTTHYGSDIPVREEASFGLSAATDLLMFAAQLVTAHPHPVITALEDQESLQNSGASTPLQSSQGE